MFESPIIRLSRWASALPLSESLPISASEIQTLATAMAGPGVSTAPFIAAIEAGRATWAGHPLLVIKSNRDGWR